MFGDDLAKMEVKFKEQLKINEHLKLQLAAEEDHYKVSSSDYRHSLWTHTAFFPAGYSCFSSGMESLMVSLHLNAVTLTVLFMSRPICETTFYCCLCRALETSEA